MSDKTLARRLPLALVAAVAAGSLIGVPPASAAGVSGAVFSGPGTYSSGGVVYAKQGTALSLAVTTDGNAECVEVIDGSGAVIATQTGSSGSTWTFAGSAYPWLVAGTGNGTVAYTLKAYRDSSSNRCRPKNNEPFAVRTASYVLDNAAPTATASQSPAPNAAGWSSTDTTLTWTGNDHGGSGVKSVTPATSTVTAIPRSRCSSSAAAHPRRSRPSARLRPPRRRAR